MCNFMISKNIYRTRSRNIARTYVYSPANHDSDSWAQTHDSVQLNLTFVGDNIFVHFRLLLHGHQCQQDCPAKSLFITRNVASVSCAVADRNAQVRFQRESRSQDWIRSRWRSQTGECNSSACFLSVTISCARLSCSV